MYANTKNTLSFVLAPSYLFVDNLIIPPSNPKLCGPWTVDYLSLSTYSYNSQPPLLCLYHTPLSSSYSSHVLA